MMKRIFAMLILICIMLSFSSCIKTKAPSDGETTAGEEESSPFDLVSVPEKNAWRDNIIARLTEKREVIFSSLSPAERNMGVSLIDVDLDGMPELALAFPGGSAGNTLFTLFDIVSGEEIGSYNAAYYGDKPLGELALYLDTELNKYLYVGKAVFRNGSDTSSCLTYTVAYDGEGKEYTQKIIFLEEYEYSEGSNSDSEKPVSSVLHTVNGIRVSHEKYLYETAVFMQKTVKIPDSDVVYIEWNDIEGDTEEEKISAMADALINSTQAFVKGKTID